MTTVVKSAALNEIVDSIKDTSTSTEMVNVINSDQCIIKTHVIYTLT
jgi:hypothetical protein